MIVSKIREWYSSNRKSIFYVLFFGFLFFTLGDSVFAACGEEGEPACTETENVGKLVNGLNMLISVSSTIIAVITSLIALLLTPGWVNGTIFGFDIYLKEIWILVSNIVYFIFAFLLITIAFMNIIGKGGDKWALKQALPKFVIGVLIVPFSWFFVQFILSISAFLTVSVLGLPYDTLEGKEAFKEVSDQRICLDYTLDFSSSSLGSDFSKQAGNDQTNKKDCKNDETLANILAGEGKAKGDGISSSVFGMINIYTYGIMKIDKFDKIKSENVTANLLSTLLSVGVKMIFDLLFLIIFLILMVALFLALFARGTWLWIHAMFSPFYGLFYFFGTDGGGEETKNFSVKEFIALAMVPVYVSAALSFGLIFIFVAAHGLSTENINSGQRVLETAEGKNPKIKVGGFTLTIKGMAGGDTGVVGKGTGKAVSDFFGKVGNGLGQLILQLFGLAILWIAVMAALRKSEVTKAVTAPIDSFGKSVGSLIADSPTYAPIIPTPGGMMSTSGLDTGMRSISSSIEQKSRGTSDKMTSMFGLSGKYKKVEDALTAIKTQGVEIPATLTKIADATRAGGSAKELARDDKYKNMLDEYGKALWGKDYAKDNGYKEFSKHLGGTSGTDIAKAIFALDKKADILRPNSNGLSIMRNDNATRNISAVTEGDLNGFIKGTTSASGNLTSTGSVGAINSAQKDSALRTLTGTEEGKNISKTFNVGSIKINNGKLDSGVTDDAAKVKAIGELAENIGKRETFKDMPLSDIQTKLGEAMDSGLAKSIVQGIEKIRKEET